MVVLPVNRRVTGDHTSRETPVVSVAVHYTVQHYATCNRSIEYIGFIYVVMMMSGDVMMLSLGVTNTFGTCVKLACFVPRPQTFLFDTAIDKNLDAW